MSKPTIGNPALVVKQTINGSEKAMNNDDIEHFFTMETNLLERLFRHEKKEAQKLLRQMIKNMSIFVGEESFLSIKYYFVTLSSLVARKLNKAGWSLDKVFVFNATCTGLIDRKLNEGNILELADELIEFYTYVLSEKKNHQFKHNTVNNVIQYINEQIESPLIVEAIAKKFKVSTSHLSRIFREHTNVTLVEYINMRKVEESQYFLRFSTKKLSEISNQFHFCNQSYFTRMFKKYTGETPKRYRDNSSVEYFHYALPDEKKE